MVLPEISRSPIEVLESRIAPSVVIGAGGKSATYTDLDGDRVTVKVSKGKLSAADFVMSSEGATVPGGEKLVMLDFSDDGREFHKANLTITAKAGKLGGNGTADIGYINAANGLADLGNVLVDGSLGRVVAGDANDGPRSPGVKLVKAESFDGSSLDCVGGIARIVITGDGTTGSGSGGSAGGAGSGGSQAATPVGSVSFAAPLLGSATVSTVQSINPALAMDAVITSGLTKAGAGTLQLGVSSFGQVSNPVGTVNSALISSGATLQVGSSSSFAPGGTFSSSVTSVNQGLSSSSAATLTVGAGAVLGTSGLTTIEPSTVLSLGQSGVQTENSGVTSSGDNSLTFHSGAVLKTGIGTGTLVIKMPADGFAVPVTVANGSIMVNPGGVSNLVSWHAGLPDVVIAPQLYASSFTGAQVVTAPRLPMMPIVPVPTILV